MVWDYRIHLLLDFKWRLNQYRDGSGSGNTTLAFFTDFETAREALRVGIETACKDSYDDDVLEQMEQMEKWGIVPDPAKVRARLEYMRDSLNRDTQKDRHQINAKRISDFIKKWLTAI
jgi:hypothetical protein